MNNNKNSASKRQNPSLKYKNSLINEKLEKVQKLDVITFVPGLICSIACIISFVGLFTGSNSAEQAVGFFLPNLFCFPLLIISNILSFFLYYRICDHYTISHNLNGCKLAIFAILLSVISLFALIAPFIPGLPYMPLLAILIGIIITIYLAITAATLARK